MTRSVDAIELPFASRPRPILRQSAYPDPEAIDSGSDEERTNYSVISRRLNKRRKTNRALVSNPFGDAPYAQSDFSSTPTVFGLDNNDVEHFPNGSSSQYKHRRRRSEAVPESDLNARQRCYEYIHSAIDAVWAEYCDSTSYAESLKYMPHSPISDPEDFSFVSSGDDNISSKQVVLSPEDAVNQKRSHNRSDSISMQPQSQSLMRQKKRLVDAKYLLSHFVAAPDSSSSSSFWKVWDQLKYNTAEIVEGDEEDIDEVIDGLEYGRCY